MGDQTQEREERLAQLSTAAEGESLFAPFSATVARLLRQCPTRFGADRAFFVLRRTPDESAELAPLTVVGAIQEDGREIADPDFHLDVHYLSEIGALDGAQYLAGAEEGVSRPLLTLAAALDGTTRGVVVLEAQPGSRALSTMGEELEALVAEGLPDLRSSYVFDTRGEELVKVQRQLEEIGELLDRRQLEIDGLRHVVEEESAFTEGVTRYHQFLTRDPKTQELIGQIERVKDTDLSVLIRGETGTGKELLARALHFGSRRKGGPFEVVPCGSIASNLLESELFGYVKGAFSGAEEDRDGFFVRADGGTLFLDEVADMPKSMQQQILRVLQERRVRPIGSATTIPVDVRVIASTRADLEGLVREKKFREDLLFRLDGFSVEIPPLRERRDDIPLLLNHFLDVASEEEGMRCRFSESAQRELYEYSWPGNVQELRNVVMRTVIESDRRLVARKKVQPLLTRGSEELFREEELHVSGDEMTIRVPARDGFNDIIAECERLILVHALRRHRGNKSRVTQQLGIPRQTLYNKLERYSIGEEEYLGDETTA